MPKRHPSKSDAQPDLFTANFADIPIRDQRDTMERPFFSLSKKPRLTPIEYQVGDVWVEVTGNPKFGIATIWDADILIWASTQVTEAIDRGLPPSRVIRFHPYHLLKSVRRPVGGDHYRRLTAKGDPDTILKMETKIAEHRQSPGAAIHRAHVVFTDREGASEDVATDLDVTLLPRLPFEASSTAIRNGNRLLMPYKALEHAQKEALYNFGAPSDPAQGK